jgi:methylated-DNA-[protein]-cysteine S-methyltransferase
MRFARVATPIGDLTLVAGDAGLRAVLWAGEAPPPGAVEAPGDAVLAAAAEQLRAWFAGERTTFDLPLRPDRGTAFERAVWAELLRIPYGETASYGEIAAGVGRPGKARAVGRANGRNPIAIICPCHRVIGSDGSLVGYGGGLDKKRTLLNLEAGALTLV